MNNTKLDDFLFTSESVSEGHPDKIADQISDAILDAIIEQDKGARVACETLVKTGMVFVGGEISTTAWVDIEQIVRDVIYDIGYTSSEIGFDSESCAVLTAIGKQSPDIAIGVNRLHKEEQGAGDQGIVFGYASNETDVFMPAPITYAHRLMQKHSELRKKNVLHWLRPDAKTQITFRYVNNLPHSITNIVFSTQHSLEISHENIVEAVIEEIIKMILPSHWLKNTTYLINPTGRFVIGGPLGDCGLTGRKIIVDSYGGMARHGGGCFSGKDPSKVDRSAAYAARYVALNIVAANLAARCEIQLSYAIGISEPIAIYINTFGTNTIPQEDIIRLIYHHFDLRPYGIIKMLDLLRPIYRSTASFGHFGRQDLHVNWEKTDKAKILNNAAFSNQELLQP